MQTNHGGSMKVKPITQGKQESRDMSLPTHLDDGVYRLKLNNNLQPQNDLAVSAVSKSHSFNIPNQNAKIMNRRLKK